jgi:hypothetical protein
VNQDDEHLRLLSVFHYVLGGITALFALFPVFHLVFGLVILLLPARLESAEDDPWRKIELDLNRLDADGLRGPSDGKIAVAYEFCIPNTDACKAEVKAIDGTVRFMAGSRGRIGASAGECLCIGSTHQKDFRGVLRRLAELAYVKRIIECHYE